MEKSEEQQLEKPGKKGPYPKSVFFIISNEFCERFSYYGMRTVLTIYLSSILLYSESDTKSIYHAFTMACYFTPLLGAIIADSWLGKFKTIFYISIIYAIGNAVLSVGAFSLGLASQQWMSMLGLGLIALGTGGIKPCVAAFGGDQFVKGQEIYLEQFFSIFYMCINAGSVLSTGLTPYLRTVHCHGQDSCYPLAFGIPAILMVVSLVLFLLGRPFYRISPPGENVIVKLGGCISRAVCNKFSSSTSKKDHWLDHADDKYDQKFIDEVKSVCRVLFIYIPVPIFWALFDQQGSTWILQASKMRWSIWGITIFPDQVQLLNPLFILILAPLFGYVVYPMFKKCGLLTKPLQKMIVGGVLTSGAFIVCMFLQIAVESQTSNSLTIISTVPCAMNVTYINSEGGLHISTVAKDTGSIRIGRPYPQVVDISPIGCGNIPPLSYRPSSSHRAPREKILVAKDNVLQVIDIPEFDMGGTADVKVISQKHMSNLMLVGNTKNYTIPETHSVDLADRHLYRLELDSNEVEFTLEGDGITCRPESLTAGVGYTYMISSSSCNFILSRASPEISLIWQAPQYILITAGEVMFSVTGLEFSYSQAPKSMKSVLQAGWLMTVAIGNLLVVIVAKIGLEKQSTEFLVFGLAMLADMVFFAVLAYFYVPVTPRSEEGSRDSNEMYDVQKETDKI